MQKTEIPRLESAVYTEPLTVKVEKSLKEELYRLKTEEKVNVAEWLRQIIRREVKALKAG